jgi:hypothetical protein
MSTPTSSAASSTSATPSTAARRSRCSPAAASSASARASSTASTSRTPTSRCWPSRARSWSPAPRPRATSAIGSDSQVRVDPFEEARELETGARREGRTRHALLAATGDLWGELVANGRAALGLDDAGAVAVDLDHPDLRGVAAPDLPYALATCASAGVVAGGA